MIRQSHRKIMWTLVLRITVVAFVCGALLAPPTVQAAEQWGVVHGQVDAILKIAEAEGSPRAIANEGIKNQTPARAACEVHGILARKNGTSAERIPKNLTFMAEQLASDQFAAFKSFRLLESRTVRLQQGSSAQESQFGSGHRVKLSLVNRDETRLKLHATLFSANAGRSLLDTDYWIRSGSIMLFAGGVHADGTLVFAIVCRAQHSG